MEHPARKITQIAREAEHIVLLAMRQDEIGTMAKALQDFVKASVAPYKYPRAVEFIAQLPRTATGKLQRFRLQPPH